MKTKTIKKKNLSISLGTILAALFAFVHLNGILLKSTCISNFLTIPRSLYYDNYNTLDTNIPHLMSRFCALGYLVQRV